MKRYLPSPSFVFGAFFGLTAFFFILGVTSYQTDHCRQENSSSEPAPKPQEQMAAPATEDAEREEQISEYAKTHPGVCGVVGFPRMMVAYMDHHEGFFVGIFTLALVIATMALWSTTQKLWASAEKQSDHIKDTNRITLRAYLVITQMTFCIDEKYRVSAGFIVSNQGSTLAKNVFISAGIDYIKEDKVVLELEPAKGPFGNIAARVNVDTGIAIEREDTRYIEEIRKEETFFRLRGRVDYTDVFGKSQFTAFGARVVLENAAALDPDRIGKIPANFFPIPELNDAS